MASIQGIAPADYYVHIDSGVAERETDCGWLLETARTETACQTGVLYEVQVETSNMTAIAVRSTIAARAKDVGVKLGSATSRWIDALPGPIHAKPASEPNFERFPEVLQFGVQRLLIAPLRTKDRLFGLLTLGRSIDGEFNPDTIELVHRTAWLLTALLERDFLHQALLERKLVDRATGILRERRSLSEEQSYLMLRSESRRRQVPMINLAKEIIEKYAQTGARFQPGVWRQTV